MQRGFSCQLVVTNRVQAGPEFYGEVTSPSRNFREKFAILKRSESVINLITLDGVNGLSILRYVYRKITF